ncbi:response regulator [Zoogloea sp.]|uniref:ANTAR domain-containing response regulator n=1 Tax=Zoogloea sp. TaxID=49181 RepID=UPI0025F0C937|nr:response regulator [Zoogloea sp.]MCK6392515.1 response regulator [Zoogloea sp.]
MSPDTTAHRARILLIEDDQQFAASLGLSLEAAGYEVITASRAEEALALLDRLSFQLAILDEKLPCSARLELAPLLREQFRLPFIMLTSCQRESCVERAIVEGALAYAIKPVDTQQVPPMIATALARGSDIEALRDTRDQLQNALNQERDISVATGMVMALLDLEQTAAFEFLRGQARSSRRKLGEVARELIASRGVALKT